MPNRNVLIIAMKTWAATVRFLCYCYCCMILFCRAKSESCFESVCEFTLVVTEFRSMTFKSDDNGKVYDVHLQQNGTLKLATSRFHLEVPNITVSPEMVHTADGTEARNIILINDLFPGPTLEVIEGANVGVKVVNRLEREGISIHWHGIHMRDNVWMDGVPYLTQCPIHPRQSFTYRFIANPPGTHFYHSHTDLQRLDGLFGALIVHRQNELGLMPYFTAVLSDWFPVPSTELQILNPFDLTRGPGTKYFNHNDLIGVSGDGVEVSVMEFWSGLINGRGRNGNNSAPLTVFIAELGQKYRMIMPISPLFQDPSTWELTPCQDNIDVLCSHIINLPLNKTVQLVLVSNIFAHLDDGGGEKVHHVMHIHGHSFRVLKIGYPVVDNVTSTVIDGNKDISCNWENDKKCIHPYWTNAPDLNLNNPPLKDTVVVPTIGYTVVRFETNNPGYWLFHCHTALHNFEGMALVFNISYEHHPPVPSGFPTCGNFDFKHNDFKMRLPPKNQTKTSRNCKSQDSKTQSIDNNLWLVETLSTIAASCSSISLLLQLVFTAALLKFICRVPPTVKNDTEL